MTTMAPAADVVAIQELKAFLRVEDENEDVLLFDVLRAATSTVEQWLGQLLLQRDLEEKTAVRDGVLRLALGPVVAIEEVRAEMPDGTAASLGREEWNVIRLPGGGAWLRLSDPEWPHCTVRYRAGLAAEWNAVPEPLRLAVIRCAAHFHATRDNPAAPRLPEVVRQLVEPFRSVRLV